MIIGPSAAAAPTVAPLTTSVSVSVSTEEKTRLATAAKAAGLSMSAYSRQAILKALGGV